MAGKPYRSKLEAYWDTIRELRQRRKSWREIAEALREQGVEVSQHALYNFVQVRRKWAKVGKFSELPHPDAIGKGQGDSPSGAVKPKAKAPKPVETPRPEELEGQSAESSLERAIAAAKAAAKGRAAHRAPEQIVERIEGLTFLPPIQREEAREKPMKEKGRSRGPSPRN
ncbi:hypothetical protein [Methylacidimicrobium tartarophylax]|uniref:Uncharacterized protein n=1 Tax=Methylacidimicrobium tartarophylax TaxID=1041768 RepID=A0A5E6MG54_9BACT|nr:hypothetical protein [Methylacidimicrobium tartarophylax]VVM08260.1 hypothetical protein MAMT_02234 [Methylacidimicrobium tartarophylax]